uniref:Uncharacterized protein n=1 Tax=Desulfovibrio sp. U5L TaxID=596152 RepID=I2Q6G1_9BACT
MLDFIHKYLRCLTGISCPIFGVSWTPPEDERHHIRQYLVFLEDRRVLFEDYCNEDQKHTELSIIDIRKETTNLIGKNLAKDAQDSLRAIRAACRDYLASSDSSNHSGCHMASTWSRLGQLRSLVGVHIARLSIIYGIEVEQQLLSIFPPADTGS